MNTHLLIASSLSVVLALAHSLLGELKILKHLKDENLAEMKGIPMMWKTFGFTKRTLRFVWHIASILGLGFAGILFYYSGLPTLYTNEIVVIKIIGTTMLLSGLVTLVLSKGSHMGWILFTAIALFCLMAA